MNVQIGPKPRDFGRAFNWLYATPRRSVLTILFGFWIGYFGTAVVQWIW